MYRALGLWIVALAAIGATILPVHAETILLRADIWCPYNCVPDTAEEGYMIDVARRIFETAGHDVEYQTLNWARSIQMAREGRIHAIVGAGKDEVPEFVFPDQELGINRNTFFVRKGDSWQYTGPDSLEGRRLGVILGYGYGPKIDAYVQRHQKRDAVQIMAGNHALENNIEKLLADRIDIVLEDYAVFRYVSQKMGVAERVAAAGDDRTRGEVNHLFIAFSPSRPESELFARLLSDGIEKMRHSGELADIMARYGLRDWRSEVASR